MERKKTQDCCIHKLARMNDQWIHLYDQLIFSPEFDDYHYLAYLIQRPLLSFTNIKKYYNKLLKLSYYAENLLHTSNHLNIIFMLTILEA